MATLPPDLLDLIERFDRNLPAYRAGHYNETQLRREFLDPFFRALGSDVDNRAGYAEAYKDVIHEDAIRVGSPPLPAPPPPITIPPWETPWAS